MATISRTTTNADGSSTVDQVTVDPIAANADTIRTKAVQALTANVTARNQIATFVAQAKPGTAALQASAAYDAVKQLAGITDTALRELNALIRLTLGQLDDVSDT